MRSYLAFSGKLLGYILAISFVAVALGAIEILLMRIEPRFRAECWQGCIPTGDHGLMFHEADPSCLHVIFSNLLWSSSTSVLLFDVACVGGFGSWLLASRRQTLHFRITAVLFAGLALNISLVKLDFLGTIFRALFW